MIIILYCKKKTDRGKLLENISHCKKVVCIYQSFLIVVAYLSLQTAVERNNKRHENCQTRRHEKKKSCPG